MHHIPFTYQFVGDFEIIVGCLVDGREVWKDRSVLTTRLDGNLVRLATASI